MTHMTLACCHALITTSHSMNSLVIICYPHPLDMISFHTQTHEQLECTEFDWLL